MSKQFLFDCVVVTTPSLTWASLIQKELEILQKRNVLPEDVSILTIEDPATNIGSGAATLNALLVVTEFLSAKQNYTIISSDVLNDVRILILHHGREYPYDPCGKAFMFLPEDISFPSSGIVTNLEKLLILINQVFKECPPGIVVSSTDMILHGSLSVIGWSEVKDAALLCVPSSLEYATRHGTVILDSENSVSNIIYCGSANYIKDYSRPDGTVLIVSGIVFLSVRVAESLLLLHAKSPLDSCTYLGMDSGAEPLQVSLFFDLLIAMAKGVTKDTFLSGKCGKAYSQKFGLHNEKLKGIKRARHLVWEELSRYSLTAVCLENGAHQYLNEYLSPHLHCAYLTSHLQSTWIHSYVKEGGKEFLQDGCSLVNCYLSADGKPNLGSGVLIHNCCIKAKNISIGNNCFLNGVMLNSSDKITIPENVAVIQFDSVGCPETEDGDMNRGISVVLGMHDRLMVPSSSLEFTILNQSLHDFCQSLEITKEDLWPSACKEDEKCLFTAKLFSQQSLPELMSVLFARKNTSSWKSQKRFSLKEVLLQHDIFLEFKKRRKVYSTVASSLLKKILGESMDIPVILYFNTACAEGWEQQLLNALDELLMESEKSEPALVCRTMSCIADLLGTMAGKSGGLRSGPGYNKVWAAAFENFEKGDVITGACCLQKERKKWLDRPDHKMRAARHYEGALQILIRQAVLTSKQFMPTCPDVLPPMNSWVKAECPARMDLQGGWSDTPPICYELGGSVVNVAVLVDGKKPVGAQTRRITEPVLTLTLGDHELAEKIVIRDFSELLDYNQPTAHGALLKACILCAEVVDAAEGNLLGQQLLKKYSGGIELQTWSCLPQGSGLGASSILAGAAVAVLWSVTGKKFDKHSILHAVLCVEQMLTTGGGWQDQVGGIMGSFNRGYSMAELPLKVQVEPLHTSERFIESCSQHFLLLYTGKVRLAKNLLQTVIRNWYARTSLTMKELYLSSFKAADAILKENLEALGQSMDLYWEQKKTLASGCEPALVKQLMELLRPHVYGQLLLGAGGGGFMCILTRKPGQADLIRKLISQNKGMEKVTVHTATIDCTGLELTRDGKKIL